MWEFFIRNTRFSYLLMLVISGAGIYSIYAIPKESAPEVQVPVGIVTTILPGAPAIDVETLVTNEIERGLSGALEDVKKITSTSQEGVSIITVEFEASADIDESITALKDEIDLITPELPAAAEDPRVTEVDFVDQPILTIAVAGDRTDDEFVTLAAALEDDLESIAGVSRVESQGVRDREVSVLVEAASLLRYDLTIVDVITALRNANNTFPVGQIISDDVTYNVVFEGDIDVAAEVSDVPITTRGGQPVYVRDVATVQPSLTAAPTLSRLSVDGAPSASAITFQVYKQSGGDITAIGRALNDRITALQAPEGLLAGLTVYAVQDASEQIARDLYNLTQSGIQTVVLVVLVLMVAIGWREGLIAGMAIPLSFTLGFIGLYLSGNTINFISLFALILGIGILVDSGIVMVEGINKRLKEDVNGDKVQAAIRAIREFNLPLISGTLTTVAMFVGLFIVSGVTGQFIASIPFTLIFVLFASLLVALGFLPLLAASYLHRRNTSAFEAKQVEYSHRLEEWYRARLRWILERRSRKWTFMWLLIVGFVSAVALIPTGFVQVVFFAQSDADAVFIEVELPEGSVKESTDLAVRRVEEILYTHSDIIEAFSVTVGAGNAFAGGGQNSKLGNVYVALRDERDRTSTAFMEELRADLATLTDLTVTVSQPSEGPPTGSAIGVKLVGDDLEALTAAAVSIRQLLTSISGTTNVSASTNSNSTEMVLDLDTAKAAAVGLNPQVISQTLRSAVFGTDATALTTLTEDIDVVVRLNLTDDPLVLPENANRTTLDALKNIELATPQGSRVLLSSLVSSRLQESNSVINHEDQERIVTVSADLAAGGNVREVNAEILNRIESELALPDGVTVSLGGESEDSNQAFAEMFLALIVGIVLMVAILVLQFDSYRHTFYVLSILPFSLIGILYGLALTGSALSFPSLMGFIALSGIVVNNSILLIDMMNQMRKQHPEKPIREVVIESSASRLRAILLTSLTTIIGMVPLLYSDDIWVPLATAVMFGLGFSVVITLILIPIIYSKYPGEVRS